MPIHTSTMTRSSMAIDWATCMSQVRATLPGAISDWVAGTRMDGGDVKAMAAFVTAGCIKGSRLDTFLLSKLLLAGMRYDIANAIASALGDAWANWIENLKMDLPGGLPLSYLAYPGPVTSVDEVAGIFPLSLSRSVGEPSLQADSLRQVLTTALSGFIEDCGQTSSSSRLPVLHQASSSQQSVTRIATSGTQNSGAFAMNRSVALHTRVNQGGTSEAIAALANWMSDGFRDWKKNTKLGKIYGQGTATTYAPPANPVGTVITGILSGNPALKESANFGS